MITGREFDDLEGHILVIKKALYGLHSSGLHLHGQLANCLRDTGFFSYKIELDAWMRDCSNQHEYVAACVDDSLIE